MSLVARLPRSLPAFSRDGLLPAGNYPLSLDELAKSSLVGGPQGRERPTDWDADWRAQLVENLGILANELLQVGIVEIFVDGSFVEAKDHPNDIDGYFVCDRHRLLSGRLERELNRASAKKCWTWDNERRLPVPGPGWKLPMWVEYRVELYPHFGQGTGIVDRFGNELQFPATLRLSRTGQPKGIVKLVR
ncbi:MAG: hypothetical protein EXS05_23490 [Planctomycetaceae bacterium]|nr:hypothetical protein [Planctomycetaceae bacterium]